MPERQSPADMLARVERMADKLHALFEGGHTWDQVPDDLSALRFLLDSHARLLAAAVRVQVWMLNDEAPETLVEKQLAAAIEAAGGGA